MHVVVMCNWFLLSAVLIVKLSYKIRTTHMNKKGGWLIKKPTPLFYIYSNSEIKTPIVALDTNVTTAQPLHTDILSFLCFDLIFMHDYWWSLGIAFQFNHFWNLYFRKTQSTLPDFSPDLFCSEKSSHEGTQTQTSCQEVESV